jgi:hypothetical protein
MKISKVWLGVGLSLLAPAAQQAAAATRADMGLARPAPAKGGLVFVAEGGESGEGGVTAQEADADPLSWATALRVIAAHYQAGLAAMAAGEQEAGAQMFAHGLSEIFAPMQEVFERRGAGAVGPAMEAAVAAAAAGEAGAAGKGRAVLAALEGAVAKGPQGAADPANRLAATVEMIDRAAMQLRHAGKDEPYEAYLDGLGFALAARDGAPAGLDWLRTRDPGAADTVAAALALALKAYPGPRAPDQPAVASPEMLSAASRAKAAISRHVARGGM